MKTNEQRKGLWTYISSDHRYMFLTASVIAALCFALSRIAPSPLSFIGNSFASVLLALCIAYGFLSAVVLIAKLKNWKNFDNSWARRPAFWKAGKIFSILIWVICILFVMDRLVLKLIYTVQVSLSSEKNPQGFLSSMIYMTWEKRSFFIKGVATTVEIALAGTAIAFVLGILMAFMRIQKPGKRDNDFIKFIKTFVSKFAGFYIFVIRGTPMMVQALIFYYAGFGLFKMNSGMTITEINKVWSFFVSGLITVALNSTAYLAEVLRGGIESIDVGQSEAARSLGMTEWQTMLQVVFPQAVKISIPSIGNEFIINIKDSSVLSVIGVFDLMYATTSVSGIYFRSLEIYCVAALLYLFLTWLSSLLLKQVAHKLDMPVKELPSQN